MPSLAYTPGTLELTGGDFNPEPVRFGFTAGRLSLAGGSFTIGPNLSSSVSGDINALLDTLFSTEALVDAQGRPTRRFQQVWQNTIDGLKSILGSQGASITELQRIYAGINAAQATAAQAVQAAAVTQSAVDLASSYTDPVGVLTADSSGVVTIAAHDRVYGDGTRVAVNGGTVSGFASGDNVVVYYSDPARAGGAVAFKGTTSAVAQTGDTHVVGQVAIPAAGEAETVGTGPTAPGYTAPTYTDLTKRQELLDIGYAPSE